MVDVAWADAEICVIGRTGFNSGIGAVCYAACELLSRHFPVTLFPTNSGAVNGDFIELPNGRQIPICRDLAAQKVFFYTDVLWNGEYDLNYTAVPSHGLRIAHIAYDSDELPAKWVEVLNNHFDVAYFSSRHLEEVARHSGVKIAIGTLPIGLDLAGLLTRPMKRNRDKLRFGSVAAYHQRKGVDLLVEAFIREFGQRDDVELVVHSNLAIGDVYAKVCATIASSGVTNITLSHANLDDQAKNDLIDTFDVFVNCSRGEGYSIGPREAIALGKAMVLSDIGPHRDLFGVAGSFPIPAPIPVPARYPEIDNQIFGRQYSVTVAGVQAALRDAYAYVSSPEVRQETRARRARANEFAFNTLSVNYAETIVPDIRRFKVLAPGSAYFHLPAPAKELARSKVGQFGGGLKARSRSVLPAFDGGFFSVFNAFMSHLTWDMKEDRCHMVLPDWDVGRLLAAQEGKKLVSFCYGRPQDGNIWLKLFEPLYGLSAEQMGDRAFLYDKSEQPEAIWNQHREPLLTYVHAFDLYKSPTFPAFRRQYHAAFRAHVRLLPHFQAEIDKFSARFSGKFMFAAHVKHPSHMIEQPGMCIAHGLSFIEAIRDKASAMGFTADGNDWGVFLATDQDRVVAQFKAAFGERVSFFDDVRRTMISEDELYDQLDESAKAKEGFQVQHLVAASPDNWSTRMAWEVIRDALVMSRCNVLFHVVSNVSTAVSYFNPDVELIFLK